MHEREIAENNFVNALIPFIGVRYNKEDIFQKFVEDVLLDIRLLSLPMELYGDVVNIRKNLNLDFDDTCQYSAAKYYGLKVVTMDKDLRALNFVISRSVSDEKS